MARAALAPLNVGRYVVLEELGRGGMGRVWRAYDPKLQREVAVKEVRSRVLGSAGAARLVAEARAMARLAHPNVVAIYDVEELPDDEVVLVMEYVAGQTLTAWLQTQRSWQERIACFRRAGRGLAAAHEAGLLHRDFKPDNVLVGVGATGAIVKVTDFGLAKLEAAAASLDSDDGRSETHGITETGVVLGTPRYMAPEQHRGDALGPAADQYAFCVALWEALAGASPFDAPGLAALEAAKTKGPPPWPGGATPRRIAAAIARGLAPDPDARWSTMHALLDELAFDPARRRRRWLQAAAAIVVVGAGAAAARAWATEQAERCTEAAARAHLDDAWDEARREQAAHAVLGIGATYASDVWARTERELDDYAAAWTRMHVEACAATAVREEQSASVMDLRMACLHRAELDLAAVTAVLADANAQTVQKADELVASLRPLERCADVEALQADVEPPLPEQLEAVDAVRAHLSAARAAQNVGRYPEARTHVDAAKASLSGLDYAPLATEAALEDGMVLARTGDYPEAELALRESLRLASERRQWAAMLDAATVLVTVVGYWQQRFEEAASYADLALGLADGDPLREARVHNNLALGLLAQGRFAEAETEQRRALELREQVLEADDPTLATTRANLANILNERGHHAEAELEHRRALALLERIGPDHPRVAMSLNNLALVLYSRGAYVESEVEARKALALKTKVLGPDHPDLATSHDAIANALGAQQRYAESVEEHRRGIALEERALGPGHLRTATSRTNLAVVLVKWGKLADAELELRRALALREHALDPDHRDVAASRVGLAETLLAQGRIAEARELAESGWQRLQREDIPALRRGNVAFLLAGIYWADDDQPRAHELAERALAELADAPERAAAVRTWIAEHPAPARAVQ